MDACEHNFTAWADVVGICEQTRVCSRCGVQERREDHDWTAAQSDAEYCWQRRCRRCGQIEGQRHTLVYAKIVTGCCVQVYVCEGCGYIP